MERLTHTFMTSSKPLPRPRCWCPEENPKGKGREEDSRQQEQHVQKEWESTRQLISGLCSKGFIKPQGFNGIKSGILEWQPSIFPWLRMAVPYVLSHLYASAQVPFHQSTHCTVHACKLATVGTLGENSCHPLDFIILRDHWSQSHMLSYLLVYLL